jgi:hypothetical protein
MSKEVSIMASHSQETSEAFAYGCKDVELSERSWDKISQLLLLSPKERFYKPVK